LSHKSWMLIVKTLLQIYNVLIRSIIDYSSIIAPLISATNLNVLQIIQNKALRIIYKKSFFSRTTNEWLHEQLAYVPLKIDWNYFEKDSETILCDLREDII